MMLRSVDGDADSITYGDVVYRADSAGFFHVPEDVGRALAAFPHIEEYVGEEISSNPVGDEPPDDRDALLEENQTLREALDRMLAQATEGDSDEELQALRDENQALREALEGGPDTGEVEDADPLEGDAEDELEVPLKNGSRAAWVEYAQARGLDPGERTRDEIISLVEEADLV